MVFMSLLVCKFGGTSVASIERMRAVCTRLQRLRTVGYELVVVVSAMGDTTDDLLALADQTNNTANLRERDMLMSTGEQQSASLLAMCLENAKLSAISLTGWQAGIASDDRYSKAKIVSIDPQRISAELRQGKIVVVAGFQALSPEGDVTTLGRGGSDTTAVALAAALNAERCLIFTDVDGVFTTDPRIVADARKLGWISYGEMLEMASLGAGVIQPRAVECGMQNHVDIEVLSSFNDHPGTIITEESKMENSRVVSGVAADKKVAKIAIFDVPDQPGIAMSIFKELAEAKVNVDIVIQSAMREKRNDISFTIEENELDKLLPLLNGLVEKVGASGMSYGRDVAKVSIIGAGMQSNPGVVAAMFEALAEVDINIQMISTSEIRVSCIIAENEAEKAVQQLHKKFNLASIK